MALLAGLVLLTFQFFPAPNTRAFEPNTTQVIDDQITVSSDVVDFGTAFPGERLTGNFTVLLVGTATQLSYDITLESNPSFEDIRPYLTVQKDPAEPDREPDRIASGPTGDYHASGNLSSTDTSDRWLVVIDVPSDLVPAGGKDYGASFRVEVTSAP
jgi:hypothetical protein